MNMKNLSVYLLFLVIFLSFSCYNPRVDLSLPELSYGIGEWPSDKYGNHRAVVKVQVPAEAVYVKIPWRKA